MCNTYWFFAATMVIPFCLSVMLYLCCLSCLYFYSAAVNINVPLCQCQHIMYISAFSADVYSLTMISTEQWLDLQSSTLTSHCVLNTMFRHEREGCCAGVVCILLVLLILNGHISKMITQGHTFILFTFLCIDMPVQWCHIYHKPSLVCARERLIRSF